MHTALGYLFTVEWAVYLGGALFMELVWRPLQRHVPPAQTGVRCQSMGRRYRWMAFTCLGLIAATGVAWRAVGGPATVWQTAALAGAWIVLVVLVASMGLLVHPLSHARLRPGEDRAELRVRRLRSIRVMDVLLRVELACALIGALIAVWPHGSGPGPAI